MHLGHCQGLRSIFKLKFQFERPALPRFAEDNRLRARLKEFASSTAFIVLAAFVVRFIYLDIMYHSFGEKIALPLGVYGETGSIAKAIAEGRGFSSPLHMFQTGPTAWLSPIFPYLVAGVFKVFGTYTYMSDFVLHFIDLSFSAFTVWPIYAIGNRAFGKTTGRAAAWAWVFCPTAIYFPVMWVWDTALAGLWMAMLFAATLALRGSDRLWWIGYGALWAVGALINPSILTVLPFLALWAIWPLRHDLARSARLAAAASLIFAVCIAPWTIRNYVVFHKFVPLRSNFGLELFLGNNSEVPDTWSPGLHPNENPVEGAKFARMTEIPYMEEKQREAFAFMRTHPLDSAHYAFRRFSENWMGIWDSPFDLWSHMPLGGKLIIVWASAFSLLSFLGVLFAYRAGKEESLPFALMMLIFPLLFYITHPSLRYRFPLDPIMQVLTVYTFVYLLSGLAARWRARALPAPARHVAAD